MIYYYLLQIKNWKNSLRAEENFFLFPPPADCVMDVRWCMLDSWWDFRLVAQKADDLATHIPSIRLFVAPGFYAHVFFFQKHVEEKKSHRRVSSNALRNYEIGKCPFELNDEIIINAINYNFLNKRKAFNHSTKAY